MSLPSDNVRIRRATEADAQVLAALHAQCFPNYWQREAFTDFFSVDGTFAWLAEAPQPVAMIVYRILYEHADIITIATHPEWRRRGIGTELLEKAIAHIAGSGTEKMLLDVEDGNAAASQLYEKHGFSVIHRRRQYYQKPDGTFTDALVMTKKLSVASE